MESKPHAPTDNEIAAALRHEIGRLELTIETDLYKMYTLDEVLSILYSIRDADYIPY